MTTPPLLRSAEFRGLFPALESYAWFDTPGSPPAAAPVATAVGQALDAWLGGDFQWTGWDAAPEAVRRRFAALFGAPERCVSQLSSVAEACAVVARGLPPGRIVVADDEFRSNLLPWTEIGGERHEVVRVARTEGRTRSEDLVQACTAGTVLVAVSDVLSNDGARADLHALRAATDLVGARLFVDATQSVGVLDVEWKAVRPDFLAVHGYKWLLCPRGAAWLLTREDRLDEIEPVAPSWRSGPPPHAYFGGDLGADRVGSRCDSSPAWLSWIGADAALSVIGRLDSSVTEQHTVGMAQSFLESADALGYESLPGGGQSHIAAIRVPSPDKVAATLRDRSIKATIMGDRLRVGFHYFNDETDLSRLLEALA